VEEVSLFSIRQCRQRFPQEETELVQLQSSHFQSENHSHLYADDVHWSLVVEAMGPFVPTCQLLLRQKEDSFLVAQVFQRPHWRNFGSYEVRDYPFDCEIQWVEVLFHFAIHLRQMHHRHQILQI
jgi:hypothetical protein